MITSDDVTISAPLPPGEPEPGEVIHELACFHRKWEVDDAVARAGYHAAISALEATFTDEQHALYRAVEVAGDWYKVASADRIVAELCRHFPLLAPAIRAVAYHIEDAIEEEPRGTCCRGIRVHVGPGALTHEIA